MGAWEQTRLGRPEVGASARTSGLLNAVVAKQLPGPGTVFLSVQWQFRRPTYLGETMTASVTVTEVRDDKPICTLATSVVNADGVVCLDGTAVTYTVGLGGGTDGAG